MSQLSSVN